MKVDFFFRKRSIFKFSKIVICKILDKIIVFYDVEGFYYDFFVYGVLLKNEFNFFILYLLGILNFKLMFFFYEDLVMNKGKVFVKVLLKNLVKLLIYYLDLNN